MVQKQTVILRNKPGRGLADQTYALWLDIFIPNIAIIAACAGVSSTCCSKGVCIAKYLLPPAIAKKLTLGYSYYRVHTFAKQR